MGYKIAHRISSGLINKFQHLKNSNKVSETVGMRRVLANITPEIGLVPNTSTLNRPAVQVPQRNDQPTAEKLANRGNNIDSDNNSTRSVLNDDASSMSSLPSESGEGIHAGINENPTVNNRWGNIVDIIFRGSRQDHDNDDRTVGTIGSTSHTSPSARPLSPSTVNRIEASRKRLLEEIYRQERQEQLAKDNQNNRLANNNSDNESVYTSGGNSTATANSDNDTDTIKSLQEVKRGVDSLNKKYRKSKNISRDTELNIQTNKNRNKTNAILLRNRQEVRAALLATNLGVPESQSSTNRFEIYPPPFLQTG